MNPQLQPANDVAPVKVGPGALVLVVGPSGAGKDTLIRLARDRLAGDPDVVFPRRLITREPDGTEENDAVSPARFELLVGLGRTALHWQAHGLGYAVPDSADDAVADGKVVVVNVSRRIVPAALAKYARVVVVLVTAPVDVLADRLAARGREDRASILERLQRAADPLPAAPSVVVIQNVGPPEIAAERLVEVVRELAAQRT
ncbi:phosphonate metabolism protein/1,5-bisphosphokinase (PRPP-forming) PhnN [Prosthecomicrobium sp. N25]|uniref:phosphonate metabolism protein/1,5-bisphosphokinase (PRPP-forming) PhnN n=1 Tax=Prosthecomicrobium sp. N25 TaxID=3129254 RepID=UPI003077445B